MPPITAVLAAGKSSRSETEAVIPGARHDSRRRHAPVRPRSPALHADLASLTWLPFGGPLWLCPQLPTVERGKERPRGYARIRSGNGRARQRGLEEEPGQLVRDRHCPHFRQERRRVPHAQHAHAERTQLV